MPRYKTFEEMTQEAEEGKSGSTLGKEAARLREQVLTEAEKKKQAEDEKKGRRNRRTILNPFRSDSDE